MVGINVTFGAFGYKKRRSLVCNQTTKISEGSAEALSFIKNRSFASDRWMVLTLSHQVGNAIEGKI